MAERNHFIWDEEEAAGVTITYPAAPEDDVSATIARIDELLADDPAFSDAGPSTLYVSRKVTNGDEIRRWFKAQGVCDLLPAEDLHVTLAYSTKPVDWMEMGEPWNETLEIAAGGPRVMEIFGDGHLVLRFASSSLQWRHDDFKNAGATWDWATYAPHVTIAKADEVPKGLRPYTGKIKLGPEIFEEIKDA